MTVITLPATTGACGEAGAICTRGRHELLVESRHGDGAGAGLRCRGLDLGGVEPGERGGRRSFTLTRTGSLTSALTVNVEVSETGA